MPLEGTTGAAPVPCTVDAAVATDAADVAEGAAVADGAADVVEAAALADGAADVVEGAALSGVAGGWRADPCNGPEIEAVPDSAQNPSGSPITAAPASSGQSGLRVSGS